MFNIIKLHKIAKLNLFIAFIKLY